jgi:uncharacterized membrane-anchored protein
MNNKFAKIRKRSVQLALLVLLQAVFLTLLAFSYYAVDWYGKEIRLKTAPVDPRDLVYGDYVVLNYDISQVPDTLWQGTNKPEYNVPVYVVLKPEQGVYQAVAVYPNKPASVKTGEVVLKGRTGYEMAGQMRILYGIERYYVPEGTGKELEDKRQDTMVKVKIAPWGQQKISGLELSSES